MQVVHNLHSQTGGCNGVLQGDIIDSTLTSPRLVLQYLHAALPGKLATLWCQTTLDLNVVRTPETWCTAPIILAPVMEKWSGRNPVKNCPELQAMPQERMMKICSTTAKKETIFHRSNIQSRDSLLPPGNQVWRRLCTGLATRSRKNFVVTETMTTDATELFMLLCPSRDDEDE